MKNSILIIGASLFINGTLLTSCSSPSEKVEDAKENVETANLKLEKANAEYLADVENYKKTTAARIAANDKLIAEFKTNMTSKKKTMKKEYKEQLAELEQKNEDMKKKLEDFKSESKEKWEIFKTEFNHDIDELGNALKDLTVKNVK